MSETTQELADALMKTEIRLKELVRDCELGGHYAAAHWVDEAHHVTRKAQRDISNKVDRE